MHFKSLILIKKHKINGKRSLVNSYIFWKVFFFRQIFIANYFIGFQLIFNVFFSFKFLTYRHVQSEFSWSPKFNEKLWIIMAKVSKYVTVINIWWFCIYHHASQRSKLDLVLRDGSFRTHFNKNIFKYSRW